MEPHTLAPVPAPPFDDRDVSAALYGRVAEYLHGVSVTGARDLNHLRISEPIGVAQRAILEAIHVTDGLGTPEAVMALVAQTEPDAELHHGTGVSLAEATIETIRRHAKAMEEHAESAPPTYLSILAGMQAQEVIRQRAYEPPYTDDNDSTAVRIGDDGAHMIHQLIHLAVRNVRTKEQTAAAIDLLHRQFLRLNRPIPRPAWLPD